MPRSRTGMAVAVVASLAVIASVTGFLFARKSHEAVGHQGAFFSAPAGKAFSHPLWLPFTGKLIVEVEEGRDRVTQHLYALDPVSGRLTNLRLAQDPECPLQSAEDPQLAPGRVLVFLRGCFGGSLSRDPSQFTQVDAVKIGNHMPHRWRSYYLPILTNALAVSPDGRRAIIDDARGFRSHLHWLGRTSLSRPIALPWTRAGFVAWAPNGRLIAADGVGTKSSAEGAEVLDLPIELYLLDSRARIKKVLMRSLTSISSPAFSPDSRLLAVWAWPSDKSAGIYVIDPLSGEARLVAKGKEFGQITWMSPNRLAVAVGQFATHPPRGLAVFTFDRNGVFHNH